MRVTNLPIVFAAVLMSTTLIFTSCKKEEVEPTPTPTPVVTPNPSNSFFAKIDGVEFQETLYTALEYTQNSTIAIVASENASFPSIGLNIPSDISSGTYNLSGILGTYKGLYNLGNGQDDQFSASSGTLTITSHDTNADFIQGTFSFTASPNLGNSSTNSFNITEGAFAISY